MEAAAVPESEALEALTGIDGIGPAVARAVVAFVAEPRNGAILDALCASGSPSSPSPAPAALIRPSPARRWSSPAR